MFVGSLVGMAGQAGSWSIGSLIKLLIYGKLRSTIYGKCDGGGGGCAIVVLWGDWGIVVLGGGVPTNNEPFNDTLSKNVGRGLVFNTFMGV